MYFEADMPLTLEVAAKPPLFYRTIHALATASLRFLRGIEASGLENVPPSGRVIVACNHVSVVDPPFAGVALGQARYARFLAKEELFRIPLLGAFFRGCGAIPLCRGRGDVGAIREALAVLENDGCLVLFPEGTRARHGKPLRPKAGVGLLARETGAPVVPARVRDTEGLFRRGPLKIRFGTPLHFAGGEGRQDCQAFAEKVMEAVWQL